MAVQERALEVSLGGVQRGAGHLVEADNLEAVTLILADLCGGELGAERQGCKISSGCGCGQRGAGHLVKADQVKAVKLNLADLHGGKRGVKLGAQRQGFRSSWRWRVGLYGWYAS